MNDKHTLVVIAAEPIQLRLVDTDDVGAAPTLGGVRYKSVYGKFSGFFDWLRDQEENILGVRAWWPGIDELRHTRTALAKYSAIELEEPGAVKIFFFDQRTVDESISCDQDFGVHRVIQAGPDDIALTFNLDGLTSEERVFLSRTAQ